MITKLLGGALIASLVACVGLLVYADVQADRAEHLSRQLAAARDALDQRERAETIYANHINRVEKEKADLEAELAALQNTEGRNEPLSDYLGRVGTAADRLRKH